ncbi:MAG: hypothetical protein U0L61_00030 [Alistipes sp.]|nr:hypothetical protein [Alistipes sp.]
MKNLFKNLMLVAVAAMAFTSCSQDVNELNKLEKKTTFEFVASFDGDTRSGFTGSSEDENGKVVYHSEWFGGETVMLVAGDQVKSATVDAEGKFTATFDGEISQIDIYTPMESFYKPYMDYNFYQVNPEVLAEQTPLANSVDPKAHVAKGYVLVDGEGNQIIPVTLAHEVAYGKMTVNTPAEFVIDHVEIALNGVFDGSTRNLSYTINADKVENNVFWFATEPITVSDFTVTAYDAEGKAYTKSVTIPEDRTLEFAYGRVGSFSVSKLEEYKANNKFTSAVMYHSYSTNDVMVSFSGEGLEEMQINFYGIAMVDGSLNVGTFTIGNGLYDGYCYYGNTQLNTITVVSTFENGAYNLVFSNLTDNNGNVVVEGELTYNGLISGIQPIDLRTKLATPSNVIYSADGKTITLSWDAVEGADGYRVKLFSPYDEYLEKIVATNEYVYEAQLYSTQYSFTIMSYASNENETYKSSDEAYAYVTTGKDPNKFADVVANKIIWDSSNGAFKMTGEVVSGTAWGHSSDYIRLYINESDRPGNNSIKVGTYTGCNSTSPQAGQFGARLSLYWGNVTYPANFGSQSTVEVSYDEAVGYTIVLTHNNVTYGYKGMPDGWVAPAEGGESGGDEPENPGDGGNTGGEPDGTVNNPYTFTTCDVFVAMFPRITFKGAEDGAELTLESNTSYGLPTGVVTLGNNGWWPSGHSYSLGDIDPGYSYSSIDQNADGSYTVNYIMIKSGNKTIFYHYSGGSIL